MHKRSLIAFSFFLFISFCGFSQDISEIKVGEQVPSFFLNDGESSFHSCTFNSSKKIIYLKIWDTEADSANAGLSELEPLHSKFSKWHFANDAGFDVVTVGVGKNTKNWAIQLKKNRISGLTNYISLDGFWDLYVKNYTLKKVPYSLLVNENGMLISADPSIDKVMQYLESNGAEGNKGGIAGKLLVGVKDLKPLCYRKMYITDKNNDTVQVLITNSAGDFTITNIGPKNELSIKVSRYPEIQGSDKVYIATQKGKVIGAFEKNPNGFTYRFLNKDIFVLKPLEEEDPALFEFRIKNKMKYIEHVFHLNESAIPDSSLKKIDVIIERLMENPTYRVEITSHTDVTGSPELNMKLSEQRAKVMWKYFVSKGIEKKRITSKGVGDKFPLIRCDDGNCTPEDLEMNRRMEFKLIKP